MTVTLRTLPSLSVTMSRIGASNSTNHYRRRHRWQRRGYGSQEIVIVGRCLDRST